MKTNTPASSQPLQQQSSCQIHFAQQSSGFQTGTNLCETLSDSSSCLGHWGAALHHFWLLQTRDSCSILPLPWPAAEWEKKTSFSFLSTSIQWWRTKLSLSGAVNVGSPWVLRGICSLQRCSAVQWWALLNNGDKSSSSCQSSTKTCPAHRAAWQGQCWGLTVSPKKTPGVCCAVCTRREGFMLLWAQWDAATVTSSPLFYLGGGKTFESKD